MNTQVDRATHVLNEVLSTMRSGGFLLVTSKGLLQVPPGREAEQFADLLAHFQQLALIRAQCAAELQQAQPSATPAENERDAMGFPTTFAAWAPLEDNIIGHGWEPAQPDAPGERDANGFRFGRRLIGESADLPARRPALLPCPASDAAPHAATESQPPCDRAQPPATPETDGGHQ